MLPGGNPRQQSKIAGAGDRDRTGMASLEGWGSTIELHPRESDLTVMHPSTTVFLTAV